MRALLDVNVLIALLDENHITHDRAWQWMDSNIASGWATCPIRQPAYPNQHTATEIAARLRQATDQEFHQFWPHGMSILATATVNWNLLISPRQLTDIYLLVLAVHNNGRFVTFDTRIRTTEPHVLSHHCLGAVAHVHPAIARSEYRQRSLGHQRFPVYHQWFSQWNRVY